MQFIKRLFPTSGLTDRDRIYREWSIQRSRAISPSDLAEIDAIFSRHL